jgi:transposase InsO family protein
MILAVIREAVAHGARLCKATELLGLTARTIQRWLGQDGGDDRREGPVQPPANQLSAAERERVLAVANQPEYRNLSPKQIVPLLADQDVYVASESTFYRVLRDADQLHHREPSRAPSPRPQAHVATGPLQLWSWDITYLPSAVRGRFYYLYLIEDVWSRKIMGWTVAETESVDTAAALMQQLCAEQAIDPRGIVLHSDNGSPMKGATMLATLQRLGIVASFSRPRVSDDNPYSEALFRTLKYRPEYPRRPFADLAAAQLWVTGFVGWYNHEHLHSAIGFVTPADRHAGRDVALLEHRRRVYERARHRHPERWTRASRDWSRVDEVQLNPGRATEASRREAKKAA